MFGDKDIIAMKIFAILKRAAKKDFWDMTEFLIHYSLQECIDAYYEKYSSNQLHISIPYAITYFVDAEESEDPTVSKAKPGTRLRK